MHTSPSSGQDRGHACQRVFRALLQALARPCQPRELPIVDSTAPVSRELASVVLTLCDQDTTIWLAPSLDSEPVRAWMRFHTGLVLCTDPAAADFAFASQLSELAPLSSFKQGSPAYPDRSTTLVVGSLPLAESAQPLVASGPGIRESVQLPLAQDSICAGQFVEQWQDNNARFPLGVDMFFCGQGQVLGLPRTTRLAPGAPAKNTGEQVCTSL